MEVREDDDASQDKATGNQEVTYSLAIVMYRGRTFLTSLDGRRAGFIVSAVRVALALIWEPFTAAIARRDAGPYAIATSLWPTGVGAPPLLQSEA